MIQQAAYTPHQASNYIGIDTDGDALKASRSTGILWGVEAPRFTKVGDKKIIYMRADLDAFLAPRNPGINEPRLRATASKSMISCSL